MTKKEEFILFIFLFLVFSNFLTWKEIFKFFKENFLEVDFFDVGQGDAIFIKTPEGHQILIDGGPDSKILEKISKEMPFWDKTIDLIILTHPERDHLSGLLEILKKYKIENILWFEVEREIPEYKEWENLIEKEGAKIKIAKIGQKISCENCDWRIEVLYPFREVEEKIIKEINDTSIVARLVFKEISLLFPGDVSKEIEEAILFSGADLKSNILKISHHGSRGSSSEKFLAKVLPETAIISVGKENKFGHPNIEVLELLEKYGIKVFRTDKNGDIKIISDGQKYRVKLSKNL